MKTHELKTWPEFFEPISNGKKTAELRYNDRDYQVGDVLHLREWEPKLGEWDRHRGAGSYTGRQCWRVVTHVLHGVGTVGAIAPLRGLSSKYVMLSLQRPENQGASLVPEGGGGP
jgi:Domain of unknown function (DUF3850)